MVGTTFGVVARQSGLEPVDFAITATFISIVVLAIRCRAEIVIALVAALVAGVLALAGASTIAVITAGALAPLIAVFARR